MEKKIKVIHKDSYFLFTECAFAMTDGVNIYIDDEFYNSKVGKKNAINALNYLWKDLAIINIYACADIPSRLKELGVNVDSMYIMLVNGTVLHEPE